MVKKIAAIIPAYNEEKAIRDVVSEINHLDFGLDYRIDAIVINDCSSDNTAAIAGKLNCVLLDLPINLGIGGAVQTGFKYAHENNFEYAVQVDGDGQHPPREIPKLLETMIRNDLDVVIGSRFIENMGFTSTFSRRIGIVFFKHVLNLFCGVNVKDSTSGFRLINRNVLNVVCEVYPDEYPEPESIVLYSRHKFNIGEVPVMMRERQGGRSSIRAFASLYYMIKVSISIFFTYIRYRNKS